MDYSKMTNAITKSVSKKLFVAGVIYTTYDISQHPTEENVAWGVLDTSVGGLALLSGYATIPSLIYYIGRIGYDVYQSSVPQEPLIFQSKGWQNYIKNEGH